MKKIILQIDGGGIKGITPAMVLNELEKRLKAKKKADFLIRDMLTLCCGASTGAIITGFIAAGVSASDVEKFYLKQGVKLFQDRNYLPPIPKYDREKFLNVLDEVLMKAGHQSNVTLGGLNKVNSTLNLMVTSYNLCSHRTHFIKSNNPKDCIIQLRDAVAWSALSAAYYFGAIDAPTYDWSYHDNDGDIYSKSGAVFQDGGQGTQNCTLDFVLTEILRQKWGCDVDEEVIIISLGTGGHTKYDSYDDIKDPSSFTEIKRYWEGQARDESTILQVSAAEYIQKYRSNIKLFRLDYETDKDYSLDDVDNVDVYEKGANKIIESPTFHNLVDELS